MKRLARIPAAILSAAVATSIAAAASAQSPIPTTNGAGFDMRLYRPAVDSKGQFSVNGTDILGHGQVAFGFLVDFAGNMFRAGPMNQALVDFSFTGVVAANVGIKDVVELGLQLPVHVLTGPAGMIADPAGGQNPPLYDTRGQAFSFQGVGDIAVHAKFRWLRAEYFPVGLAIILQGGFSPMQSSRSLMGEPVGFIAPSAAVEIRPRRQWRIDLNLGARIPFAAGSRLGSPGNFATYGPSITWGAGASYRPAPFFDMVLETYGAFYLSGGDFAAIAPWEMVGGFKVFVERNSYLMLGGGARIGAGTSALNAPAAADWRAFLGFVFEPTVGDTDGDGYRDDVDKCITDPEDFDNFEDDDGCSEPDNDKDGILDASDDCPLIPEDKDGDKDGDGCPEGQAADRDGDGLNDSVDQCVDEPEDKDQFKDDDGCPDPDNDNDTLPDPVDGCPNEAEDDDDFEDEDGCPDSGDIRMLGNEIDTPEIRFAFDRADILPESMPIITQIVGLLQKNTNIEKLVIEGHTDERGEDAHNLRLSNDRANSVMQALSAGGVAPGRLIAAGYGEFCPRRFGHTETEFAINRRVRFVVIRTTDAGRTTARAGCARGSSQIPAEVGPPGTGVAREQSRTVRANESNGSTPAPNTPAPNTPAPGTPAPAPKPAAPASRDNSPRNVAAGPTR